MLTIITTANPDSYRLVDYSKIKQKQRQLEKLRQQGIFPFVLLINLRQWFDPTLIIDSDGISRFMAKLLKSQIRQLEIPFKLTVYPTNSSHKLKAIAAQPSMRYKQRYIPQLRLQSNRLSNLLLTNRDDWNAYRTGTMYAPWESPYSNRTHNNVSVRGVPFKKIKLIGEGYQSVVYEAKNIISGFRYAMKIVTFKHPDPREQKDLFKTFLKEVNLLIKLNNQSLHFARIYDYDIDLAAMEGKIIMELGIKDFRSMLPLRLPASLKIINEPRRKYYWKQMVEAIRFVHLNGITHADVKPENFIFVCNVLKIIDFGMSFIVPFGRTTSVRPFAGTPDYMPPEVCRKTGIMTKFGFKADIWSLGCILYEMSFGMRPFEHIHGDIEKMRYIASTESVSIPASSDFLLLHVMEWCLQPDESLRPSAQQLLEHPYLKY